jgi:hypothetical protein
LPIDARKSQKEFKRFKATSQSFFEPNSKINNYDESGSGALKVTLPQPFSFDQREKERQMARSQQKVMQSIP